MLTSTQIHSIQPYGDSGNIGLISGEYDGKPTDLAAVIVVAFHTDSRKEVGKAASSATGKFLIPIGPLGVGAWSITVCLLKRDGTLNLPSSSNAFTYVVRGGESAAQAQDGMVNIPPPYQS
jgi:hypothetical protein